MFERNKVDNVDQTSVPVEVTTIEGEVTKGRLLIALGRNVFEVLNGPASFLEFEPYGGERSFVAKSTLRNVKLVNVPRVLSLSARLADGSSFDPHTVLGVPSAASFEDIKAAWHRLSKVYHPDRYQSADLPPEVREYLAAMARRVNAAFSALESAHLASRRVQSGRATPIYTSAPR